MGRNMRLIELALQFRIIYMHTFTGRKEFLCLKSLKLGMRHIPFHLKMILSD